MIEDYATGRAIEHTPEIPKVYLHSQGYKDGQVHGVATHGHCEPRHANQIITAISNVLNDSPDDWCDRIIITVGQ